MAAAALGLVLVGGCSGASGGFAPPVQETTGLLGNGVFRWVCVTSADPTCGTGVFPTAIAVGAAFDLEFSGSVALPSGLGLITLEPVSPTRLARVSASVGGELEGELEGQLDGDVSVVAFGDGYGIDYVQLTFRSIDDLELGEPEPDEPCVDADSDGVCDGTGGVVTDPAVELVLGESTELRVRALGGGEDLAGAIDYTWESLTPELVEITSTFDRSARVSALGLGVARLSVRAGDYVEVFEHEVQESPLDPGSSTGMDEESDGSGGMGSGAGSESGSGSDSDTGSGSGSGSDSGSGSESGSESGSGSETSGTTTGGV